MTCKRPHRAPQPARPAENGSGIKLLGRGLGVLLPQPPKQPPGRLLLLNGPPWADMWWLRVLGWAGGWFGSRPEGDSLANLSGWPEGGGAAL